MKKRLMKLLSLFLAILMCVSVLPVSALSEEPEELPEETLGEPAETPEDETPGEDPPGEVGEPAPDPEKIPESPEELELTEETPPEEPALSLGAPLTLGSTPPDALASGICGTNLTWSLSSSYVLTIEGSGAMDDFNSNSDAPWYAYRSSITAVNIGSGVTSIGRCAFQEFTAISAITIPDSVVKIGTYAFLGCENLKSVSFGTGLNNLDSTAFDRARALETVTVASGNERFRSEGNCLIEKYSNTVVLGTNLSVIPAGVTAIGAYAFAGRGFSSYTVPEGITSIGALAFGHCSQLWKVTLPVSLTAFGNGAFSTCTALTDVYYNGTSDQWETVEAAAIAAEGNENLLNATLHCTLTGTCGSGLTWTLSPSGELRISGSGAMNDYFAEDPNRPPWYSEKYSITSIVIEEGVSSIGKYAFLNCGVFTTVTIPESVSSIGQNAFMYCDYLTDVTYGGFQTQWNALQASIGSGNTKLLSATLHCDRDGGSWGDVSWRLTRDYDLTITGSGAMADGSSPSDVPWGAYNESIRSVSIGSGVTSIGGCAFYGCTLLTEISIPGSVASIGAHAFYGCSQLTDISIPNSVTSIGAYAFLECDRLKSVSLGSGLTSLANTAFDGDFELETITLASGNSKYRLENNCLIENSTDTLVLGGIVSSVPSGVTSIGSHAFHTRDLTELVLPEGVTSIGANAFDNCFELTSISLPLSLASIGSYAFNACEALTDVHYPGTQAQWNTLRSSIGSGNSYLTNATLHCIMDSGTWGGISWTITRTYDLSLTGSGDMPVNCGETDVPWYGYRDNIRSVSIGSGITGIGYYAFAGCRKITEINIPSGVTTIGNSAFYDCDNLTEVNIPDSVYYIDDYAFRFCDKLKSVHFGTGLATLGTYAFAGDPALDVITVAAGNAKFRAEGNCLIEKSTDTVVLGTNISVIPSGVKSIGTYAFYGRSGLTSLVVPDSVTRIQSGAFYNCNCLKTVTLPDTLTAIGSSAFHNCDALTDVYFNGTEAQWDALQSAIGSYNEPLTGETVTVHCLLDGGTWGGITWKLTDSYDLSLTGSGDMPNGNGSDVPWYAYRDNIRSVSIGSGITSIGQRAFYSCGKITEITIPDSVTAIGQSAFYNCNNLTALNIPDSVTSIDQYAFYSCDSLKSVHFGAGLTELSGRAFGYAPALETVTVAAGNAKFRVEGNCLIENSTDTLVVGTKLSVIPAGVKIIGDEAFDGRRGLTELVLPEGVTSIDTCAFYNCTNLKTVTLPNTLTAIDNSAFFGCSELTDVYFNGSEAEWNSLRTSIDSYENEPLLNATVHFVLGSGTCGTGVSWVLMDGVLTISGSGAMDDWNSSSNLDPWYELNSEVTSIEIGAGITHIGNYAFYGVWAEDVVIPEGVTSIGAGAFQGSCLTSVVLPDSVTTIGEDAFYCCSYLKSATLGSGITSISNWCFCDCTSLETVYIPEGVTSIGISAFNKSALTEITLPDGLKTIGTNAFGNCEGLVSVTLPDSLTTINDYAFSNCSNLRDIYFCGSRAQWEAISVGSYNEPLTKATLHCFEDFGTLKLTQSYLLVKTGESVQLTAVVTPDTMLNRISWSSEDPGLASVSADGLVTAGSTAGTTYIKVSLTAGGKTLTARCRIDVTATAAEAPAGRNVTGVQLITTSASPNVYKTEGFKTVSILPLLEQNKTVLSTAPGEPEDKGVSVVSAKFASASVDKYFSLRVKDDRTLEIVPTEAAVAAAQSKSKSLKDSYSSKIEIKIAGYEEPFTTSAKLKLTVKKSLPSVKAKKITFNSYVEMRGYPYVLSFTGGTVTALELNETAAKKDKKTALPSYMEFDAAKQTLALSESVVPSKYPSSGTVYLKATVAGWAVPVNVKAAFAVKKTAPKLNFSAKSLTLLQGVGDNKILDIKVSPAAYDNSSKFNFQLTGVEVLEGDTYKRLADLGRNEVDVYYLGVIEGGYRVQIRSLSSAPDGKAHTYRVTMRFAGKTFTYPVKTLATTTKPALTAKVSGGINVKVANSPVKVTLSPKNFHDVFGVSYKLERIEKYKSSKLVESDVRSLFNVSQDGKVFTLTAADPTALKSAYTYKAVFGVDLDGDGVSDGTVKATLKISWPSKTPSITTTVKKTGSLDLTRRSSKTVTLKTSVSNYYGAKTFSYQFYQKVGKKTNLVAESDTPFVIVQTEPGVYSVSLKSGWTTATEAFSIKVTATDADGKAHTSAAVSLPVVKGKVTVKSSANAFTLYKKDRNIRGIFTLSIADSAVSPIDASRIKLDSASAKKYQLVALGDNTWGLEYTGRTLPLSFVASTVKVTVYVEGCEKSVATVNLKVSFK